MTIRSVIALLVLAYSLTGCNSRSPVAPAPTSPPGVSVAQPTTAYEVFGYAYFAFYGTAGSSIATSTVSTITSAFDGSIEYCVVKSPTGLYDDCYEGRAIAREVCQSKNHQLTLTRR
jgi:hypothetical protein